VTGGLADAVFSAAFLTQAVRITVPYACAAVGGAVTERAGVIDLAIESKLLWGAFAAALAAHATGSIGAGIAAGVLAGALVGLLQLLLGVVLRADQVVVGVALNLASYGLTRYLLHVLFGSTASSPQTPGVGSAVWTSPVFWLALAAIAAVAFALARTAIGLRIRAAGDRPDALVAAGVSPTATRLVALVAGGALAGLGGAQLALAAHGFSAEMSGGRGYIALAIVILGGWRPAVVAAFCLAFGAAEALQLQLQLHLPGAGAEGVRTLAQLLPYLLTLLVLVIAPRRTGAPRALGRSESPP
jgi:general nucleoside transport system permease protein